MKIKGKVLNVSEEKRQLVGKDGTKREALIKHVLMLSPKDDGKGTEVVNIRAYDSDFPLPEMGKDWISPDIKKYENFDGNVANVLL